MGNNYREVCALLNDCVLSHIIYTVGYSMYTYCTRTAAAHLHFSNYAELIDQKFGDNRSSQHKWHLGCAGHLCGTKTGQLPQPLLSSFATAMLQSEL